MNKNKLKVKQLYAKDFINETNKNKISNEFLKKCRKSALLFKKGEDNMKKSDLKNGMSFECRGGAKYFIINGKIYRDKGALVPTGTFEERMKGYSDDLLVSFSDGKMDIMKIYDIDNKLIWEREEIDWSKIPVDTKVLVKNDENGEWDRRYFAGFINGEITTFSNGMTSWSTSRPNNPILVSWKYAKLVENKKVKNENIEDIENQFAEYCKGKRCATECGYYGSLSCILAWLLDNYNVSPK